MPEQEAELRSTAEALDQVVTFLPYQKRWLADDARFKVGMFARQTGKTFTTCAEIVDDCIQAEIRNRRTRWVILSRGERQAKEAVDEAIKPFSKAFYAVYNTLLKGKQPPTFEEGEFRVTKGPGEQDAVYKTLEVIFPSGSRITALPANPDTARGFSANVFLDEFAFHADSRRIWAAVFPVISKKGLKLRVTSTPNGKDNKFYELMTAKDSLWSRHVVDIHSAIADGLERDADELKSGLNDDDIWDQEYLLKWQEAASAWLSYALINGAEDDRAGRPELYQGGLCYVGNDIARRSDLWVAWVWEQIGDVFWTREIVTLKNKSFSAHDAAIADIMDRYKVMRLSMDQTGMGEKPVEDMKRAHGDLKVEGVLFTPARRLNVATVAKQLFQDHKTRIPAGDDLLRADLHKLKGIESATGSLRLIAPRDTDGHADRTWAAFLGLASADGVIEPASADVVDETGAAYRSTRGDHRALGRRLGALTGFGRSRRSY
jgi:phage FluMu gp28-like protein